MQLNESDLRDGDAGATALTILRSIGERAIHQAEAQIALCADRPDLVQRWTAVVEAMRIFVQAHAHMTIALGLLDTLDFSEGTPQLDAAICHLGLRDERETASASPHDTETHIGDYYGRCCDRHLRLAGERLALTAKGRHLNIASNYATLQELTALDADMDFATVPLKLW